jgi:hypothetical protein
MIGEEGCLWFAVEESVFLISLAEGKERGITLFLSLIHFVSPV